MLLGALSALAVEPPALSSSKLRPICTRVPRRAGVLVPPVPGGPDVTRENRGDLEGRGCYCPGYGGCHAAGLLA